jgi:hypothetical protein
MTTSTTTPKNELLLDTLRAMRLQEVNGYRIVPTSHLSEIVRLKHRNPQDENKSDDGDDSIIFTEDVLSVYLKWRTQMVRWCFSIAHACHFQNETVEITMSIMDRYVAVHDSDMTLLLDALQYQLSCMACMYTAIKVHEPQCLTPQQMEHLSGGRFTYQQIQETEAQILKAIQWRVNPPTAIAFVRCLLELSLPESHNLPDNQKTLLEVVETQIELALAEDLFIPVKASSLALSALMNAVQSVLLQEHSHVSPFYWNTFAEALHVDKESGKVEIQALRKAIQSLVLDSLLGGADSQMASSRSTEQQETSQKKQASNDASHERSPRSVISSRRYSTQ